MKLLRKRVLVPAALFLTAGALLLVLVLRGTWTSEKPPLNDRRPGPVSHLWLDADGRKVARAAVLVDLPIHRLWEAVTDYERFPQIFPSVSKASATVDPDGRHFLRAEVSAGLLGAWPVAVAVRHEDRGDQRIAWWDETGDDILRNRGRWVLTRLDDGRTMVEYLLDVEIRRYPDWFVRAVLRGRQKGVLQALVEGARR